MVNKILGALLIGLIFIPFSVFADVNGGLIAYYPFNSNALDESGNGNHGVIDGAQLTSDRHANSSKAYHFDGVDDYIGLTTSKTLLAPKTAISISTWVNRDGHYNDLEAIISTGWTTTNYIDGPKGYFLGYAPNTGTINWSIKIPGCGEQITVNSFQSLTVGTWFHVVATWDTTTDTFEVYLNGKLINSISSGCDGVLEQRTDEPIYIGRIASPAREDWFRGSIDDVRIYNRVISSEEVQQLFTGDFATTLTQTHVSQLYVSIFGRASEGDGNDYWMATQNHMEEAANAMLATDAAQSYFGSTLDDNQTFIEFIYKNTLGKTYSEDPDGVDYWVGELTNGKSKGNVIAALINAVTDPQYAGSPAQEQFMNKVTVSNYTADKIKTIPDVNDLAAFVEFISDVTDDSATVTTATAAVDAFQQ